MENSSRIIVPPAETLACALEPLQLPPKPGALGFDVSTSCIAARTRAELRREHATLERTSAPHQPPRNRRTRHWPDRGISRTGRCPPARPAGSAAADHADDLPGAACVLAVAKLVGAERVD